jgi:hypothetical protein
MFGLLPNADFLIADGRTMDGSIAGKLIGRGIAMGFTHVLSGENA